jgi:methylenetetrahydrofolate--tRNA-(uracil-5-)-methyltransferase
VPLRPEDEERTAYNMVGFQTRMKWPEQKRVFAMIPGLENVEIVRYGSVHRNTFVEAPRVLDDELALPGAPGVHLAGQITGVEGYVESAACGLVLGVALARRLSEGVAFAESVPPRTTALGSLWSHLRTPSERFQPSNVIFSMFPALGLSPEATRKLGKRGRYAVLAERALTDLGPWLERVGASKLPTARVGETRTDAEPDAPPAQTAM